MCHMKLPLNIWPDMQIQYEFQTLYYYYELTNNRIILTRVIIHDG